MENIIKTNNMKRTELIRELLTELTYKELKQLVQFSRSIKKTSHNNVLDKLREKATFKIRKPVPTPRKTVKQMVKDYEDNIIPPPKKFRDDYKPVLAPRTKKLNLFRR